MPTASTEKPFDLRRLIVITVQLAVVMFTVYQFKIVDAFGFNRIVPLIFGGFVVNSLLPMRYRRTFFLLLSFAAIFLVIPWLFSITIIVVGLGLILICHLPIPLWARVAILLAGAAAMASLRNGWDALPHYTETATLVMPVLGAMFMFRLAIYLYDLRYERTPASLSERLAYFFMLPNACFLLFPVIDYRTYRQTYYNTDQYDIYQTGVLWILRGLTHLLLYRLVYGLYLPAPDSVVSFSGVIQFMLTTYLLYLRISGQFHMIVGILCLFGFNLPETQRLFFLAYGFNDFWRRINIYWKDFMVKMVYFPVLMPLKKFGAIPSMIVATLVVFVSTWLLHSYQVFWLQGSFPITAPDAIFWGALAVLVVGNTLLEATRGRKRSIGQARWSFKAALILSVKTIAMFSTICVFWSLWNSASVEQWLQIVTHVNTATSIEVATAVGVLIGAVGLGVLFQYLNHLRKQSQPATTGRLLINPVLYTLILGLLLLALTFPSVTRHLPERATAMADVIQRHQLNANDRRLVERGYYEDLLDNPKFTITLGTVHARRQRPNTPDWLPIRDSLIAQATDDFLEFELRPSHVGSYWDAPLTTNQWGMRDQEYALEKPPGVYRVAWIGASMTMAGGVESDQTFESLIEERLNREHAGDGPARYQLLNFSVVGYGVPQKFRVADRKIDSFEPDMVIVPLYNTEESRTMMHLEQVVQQGLEIPYPALQEIVDRSGAEPGMSMPEIRLRLKPYIQEVMEWSLRELRIIGEQRGYDIVPIFFPEPLETRKGVDEERHERLMHTIRAAGFEPLRLDDMYEGHALSELRLAPWDTHLSVYGNQLVADRLYELLEQRLLQPTSPSR